MCVTEARNQSLEGLTEEANCSINQSVTAERDTKLTTAHCSPFQANIQRLFLPTTLQQRRATLKTKDINRTKTGLLHQLTVCCFRFATSLVIDTFHYLWCVVQNQPVSKILPRTRTEHNSQLLSTNIRTTETLPSLTPHPLSLSFLNSSHLSFIAALSIKFFLPNLV